MKAIGFYQHGHTDQLQIIALPRPEPGPGEVLINVKAVALNHLDLWVLEGLPGLDLEMPHVGGSDIAGVITELGDGVTGLEVGRRVVVNPTLSCGDCEWCRRGEDSLCDRFGVIGEHTRGGMAEYVAVPARNVMVMPDDFAFSQAAAVPLGFLTAWRALITRGQVQPGEEVLILGAGGGVASAAIQIAKLAGANVYAVTSSPEKVDKARALGADWTVDRTQENWSKAVFMATNKRGVDIVLENVGAATWFDSLRSAKKGGRIVTYGATTGARPETDIRYIFWKQLSILGTTMSARSEFHDVMNLVWQGKLKPVVDSVFPMEEAQAAYRRLEAGEQFGKVVIEIG
ncbi:MAG: zinc-binding dehydrogenase, partial [Anaerolineae bacterium]